MIVTRDKGMTKNDTPDKDYVCRPNPGERWNGYCTPTPPSYAGTSAMRRG